MKTSLKQTSLFTGELSTSSAADSHASHFQQPVRARVRMTPDTFGRKCSALYEKFAPVGSWERMFMDLLIGAEDWFSTRCALTWKMKASKSSRLFCQLQVSALSIAETGSGLSPTITASFGERGGKLNPESNHDTEKAMRLAIPKLLKTPCAADAHTENMSKKEQKFGNSGTLAQEVQTGFIYQRGMLPTPPATDYKGAYSPEAMVSKDGINRANLLRNVYIHFGEEWKQKDGKTSQLNPRFVAEMMGFPPNWTESPFQSGETNP